MAKLKMPQARHGFKTCAGCLQEKPLEAFDYEPRVKSQTTAQCKQCIRAAQKLWAQNHPERVQASRKKYAKRFPERVAAAAKFSQRREALERREHRITNGQPLLEPKETAEGRLCSRCRRRKDHQEFPPDGDGFSYYCRECTNRIARKNSKKPSTQSYRKKYMRELALKKYGLTLADFEKRIADQEGKCAICSEELKLGTGGCGVDHDHATGRVRGILCRLCNVGVGHFRENPELFARAMKYLTQI